MSQKDTYHVNWWRVTVTGVLLLTAIAVTLTTHTLLVEEKHQDFEMAVSSLTSKECEFSWKWLNLTLLSPMFLKSTV